MVDLSLDYETKTIKIHKWASAQNMISSLTKITWYLHMWKDHHCYGWVRNGVFCSESEMTWDFIGINIINTTLRYKISAGVERLFHLFAQRQISYHCMAV